MFIYGTKMYVNSSQDLLNFTIKEAKFYALVGLLDNLLTGLQSGREYMYLAFKPAWRFVFVGSDNVALYFVLGLV
jgi:hypothetical protein